MDSKETTSFNRMLTKTSAMAIARDRRAHHEAVKTKCFHPSGSFVPFNDEDSTRSVPERFTTIVTKYPERLAVKIGKRRLTYAELNEAANRVADALLQERGREPEPVALLFGHGIEVIIAILAVLKAGKFYVALEPSFPLERIRQVLEGSGTDFVLTDHGGTRIVDQLGLSSSQVLNIDKLDGCLSRANPDVTVAPGAVSHLIYTSGSTGKPKGVVQTHLNMLNEIKAYTNGFRICPEDRLTLFASSGSGQGVKNVFCALLTGASLFPFPAKSAGLAGVPDHLLREEITVYHSSVTLFRQLVETLGGQKQFPQLRLIRLASQEVLRGDFESYKRCFARDCIMVNALSSTETGTVRWYFIDKETSISEAIVPVGYALDDKSVLLLDAEGNEVGFDQVGEIVVRSQYLSPGYWKRLDLTEAKFRTDSKSGEKRLYLTGDLGIMLSDGCLIYKGRKDFRVKIRGYGVEVAEVERALLEHPSIKEAAVLARPNEMGEARLIAYFTSSAPPYANVLELQKFLRAKLPDYMIPAVFVMMDALPLTAGGKIDRQSLPEPGKARPELDTCFVAPATPAEAELARLWGEVLCLDRVTIFLLSAETPWPLLV